jgi:hypothetical protein
MGAYGIEETHCYSSPHACLFSSPLTKHAVLSALSDGPRHCVVIKVWMKKLCILGGLSYGMATIQ